MSAMGTVFKWEPMAKLERLSDSLQEKLGWVLFTDGEQYLAAKRYNGAWRDVRGAVVLTAKLTKFKIIDRDYPAG